MRAYAFTALAALAAALSAAAAARADEDFSIVVNPRTGAASLRNDGASPINLDGYLLRAGTPVFDVDGWSGLAAGGDADWAEGAAAPNRLSETNLFGSLSLPVGGTIDLGAPYTPFEPTAIGQAEPEFNLSYHVPGEGSFPGDVEFSVRNNVVLVVDPMTGDASLENQSEFDVSIDGYLVKSLTNVLDTGGWTPLESSLGAGGGWRASAGAANRIAEGNLLGSSFLAAGGGSLDLGAPINPDVLDDESDLVLEYHIEGVGSVLGSVLFTSAAAPGLPGDFNNDGFVNGADYPVWRDGLGATYTADDYDTWRNNYGATTGGAPAASASAPVPTPSGLALVLIGWAGAVARRRVRFMK